MGYCSDVIIIYGEKAYILLQKTCMEYGYIPDVKLDGEFYVLR